MSYKILTKNGIDNTNIDGARNYHFNAGMRSGIVKGALNEGNFNTNANNSIFIDTCELRICGHRIIIDEPVYKTLSNTPATNTRYSFVAQIQVDDNSFVSFSMFLQDVNQPLIQDNLYKTGNGAGTYQLEIGRFTQQTDGTIVDITRTADLITGGIGNSSSGTINIGNVTTNTLDAGMEAFVDVEQRYNEQDKKTYTDFYFDIPKGYDGSTILVNGTRQNSFEMNTKQDKLTAGENITISENGVISATKGTSITVDDALSDTSENAVQNKVITNVLSSKANKSELPIGLPIGSIIMGAIPLNDASVHLLDGGTISQTGVYSDFCTYLKSLAQTNPNIVCTEAQFNSDVSSTGNCGKFVIDNTAGTIRLPKITRFIQGLTSITNIGTSVTAGLPNITGNIGNSSAENRIMGGSTVNQNIPTGGAFTSTLHSGIGGFGAGNGYAIKYILNFDAHSSNTIYGNSNTVQPEATQYPYYIVLANSVVTQVLVDINNIISELNNKVSNNSGANISVGDILSNGHATLYVEDSGDNHIRRSDGWQICMGRMNARANSRTTFTLPMPFKDKYAYNVIAQDGGHENSGQWGVLQKTIPISSTQFTLFNAGDETYLFTYIAIGRWK